jgi:hypothetical protein
MNMTTPKAPTLARYDSLGCIYFKNPDGSEQALAVPVEDTTMWQDDEDNNPYGSFNQDSTGTANPALSASCTGFSHGISAHVLTVLTRP